MPSPLWVLLLVALCQVSCLEVTHIDIDPVPPSPIVQPLILPIPAVHTETIPLTIIPEVIPKVANPLIKPEKNESSILWTVADIPAPKLKHPEKIVLTVEPSTTGENQLYRTIDGKLVKVVEYEVDGVEKERPSEKCFSYFFPAKTKDSGYLLKSPPVPPQQQPGPLPATPFGPVSPGGIGPLTGVPLPPPPPEISASSYTFPRTEELSGQQQKQPIRVVGPLRTLRYHRPAYRYAPVSPLYRHHIVGHVGDTVSSGVGLEKPGVVKVEGKGEVVVPDVKKEGAKSGLEKGGVTPVVGTGKSAMRNKGRWFWSSSYYDPYDYYEPYDYYDSYGPYDYSYGRPGGHYWYNPYYKSSLDAPLPSS